MNLDFSQAGPAILYILVGLLMLERVVDLVLKMTSKKNGSNGGSDSKVAAQVAEVDKKTDCILQIAMDMQKMHDVRGDDGVPVWYVRAGMTRAIENQTAILTTLNQVLERLVDLVEEVHEKVESL